MNRSNTICNTSKIRIFRVECQQTKPFSFQFPFPFDLVSSPYTESHECFRVHEPCLGALLAKLFHATLFSGLLLFRRCRCCVQNDTAFGTPTPIISLSMNVMWLVAHKPMHFVFWLAFRYYLHSVHRLYFLWFFCPIAVVCVCKHINGGNKHRRKNTHGDDRTHKIEIHRAK